ncbi:oxidoreductase, partial [Klebsiella pneumoniae]|nr:oxidoreductase [Klebsiella pneumoniae]
YPLDEHASEINNPLYLSRFIWQVNKITVLK